MPKLIVEACCGSADDVIEAQKAGADRVELNSNLSLGGLTPSLGTLKTAKAETGLPIMAMVRPRESAFLYTAAEFRTALLDAEALLANGADGIVFGFLNSDGTVDAGRCREMLRLASKSQTVFHRAIDVVPDWRAAIDLLCELGVTRILTSGQRASVFDGHGGRDDPLRARQNRNPARGRDSHAQRAGNRLQNRLYPNSHFPPSSLP